MCGDDDDCGEFAVDGGDQGEDQRRVGLENENEGGYGLRGLPRRPLTIEGAHKNAEIEPCDMDQVALVELLPSAQPGSTHAAAIEDMGKGPLDQLAAPAHRLAPDIRSQPHAIGVDRCARRLIAMPTQVALGRLGFGDARLPHAAFKSLQLFAPQIVRASINRALTNGLIGVNAVYAESDGRLQPFLFDTDAHFYRGSAAPMFAIWRTGDDPFNWYRVNADTVAGTYGSPTRVEHLPGGFVLEILREPLKQSALRRGARSAFQASVTFAAAGRKVPR